MPEVEGRIRIGSSAEFAVVEECLGVLSPFNEATVELSTEKKVSASKIIPLMKMLDYTIGEQKKQPWPRSLLNIYFIR